MSLSKPWPVLSIAQAQARLAAFKVPVRILFWPDLLPRNATGKLVKTELQKLFAS